MVNDRYLKFLNPVLFLVVLTQASTGIAIAVFDWHAVLHLHQMSGFALTAVVATHITLNRGWIAETYFGRKRTAGP